MQSVPMLPEESNKRTWQVLNTFSSGHEKIFSAKITISSDNKLIINNRTNYQSECDLTPEDSRWVLPPHSIWNQVRFFYGRLLAPYSLFLGIFLSTSL